MNAKLSGFALGVSVIALLVAVAGSTFTIAFAPEMDVGVQGDLVPSAEAIRVRVDSLERQNGDLREALTTAQSRLKNVESVCAVIEDQMETVSTELAKLEESSAAAGRAIFRFGRTQAVLRQRLGISDAESDAEMEKEEEEPKLEDYLSIVLEPINGLPGPHIIIEGANFHVQSGSGGTDDFGEPLFGLGNFVIGYNEQDPAQFRARTGSHNLIVGSGHGYTSFGGLVAGYANEVNAPSASVSGGTGNQANSWAASVSGGERNLANGDFSSVTGGVDNKAVEKYASVTGGSKNEAKGWAASVTGGRRNSAVGDSSTVMGGLDNRTDSSTCAISGGMGVTLEGKNEGYWMVGQLKSEPDM